MSRSGALDWRRWGSVFLIILIGVMIGSLEGQGKEEKKMEKEGEKRAAEEVRTERIGRFAIDIPVVMHRAGQEFNMREWVIHEVTWPKAENHDEARIAAWNLELDRIRKLTPPEGKDQVIIETREFSGIGPWTKGVLYYDDEVDDEVANWNVLVDAGPIGVRIYRDGSGLFTPQNVEKMSNVLTGIAKAYRYIGKAGPNGPQEGNWFYLEHGGINLPYFGQERAYVRFEGHPLGLTLEIEMNSTFETEVPGLLDRIDVTIRERFAPEVKQEKIRTRKRKVAGLDGEEAILRSSYRYGSTIKKTLDFAWLFPGKKDSGEYPEVILDMESEEGQLEEKIALWDRMLDSMTSGKWLEEGRKP